MKKSTLYPHKRVHKNMDLRPSIGTSWKLLQGYPSKSVKAERLAFEIEAPPQLECFVYKYTTVEQKTVIVQFFTKDHNYLGGGDYVHQSTEPLLLMSDEDMKMYNNVVQF